MSKKRNWAKIFAFGSIISSAIGIYRIYFKKEKKSNFFGKGIDTAVFKFKNNSAAQQPLSIFNQTVSINPAVTVTGADLDFFTRTIPFNPIELISIGIKSGDEEQHDIPFNLTYKDIGGEIKTTSFTPEQSEMQNRDDIARTNFENATLDNTAQINYAIAPNASVTLIVEYKKK